MCLPPRISILWISLFLIFVFLITGCTLAGNHGPLTGEPSSSVINDGQLEFTNNIDGYRLTLPEQAQADMSMAQVRTAFSFDGVKLYVYAQATKNRYDQSSYISYSNSFLAESRGITVTGTGSMKLDGCKTSYNIWTRQKLSRVKDDLNNYACYDIRYKGKTVYTLFFKYDSSVSFDQTILPIVQSFQTVKVTAQAPEVRLGNEPGPVLDEEAEKTFSSIFADSAGLTWGLFDYRMQGSYESTKQLERDLNYEFSIYLLYTDFQPTVAGERLYDLLCRVYPDGKIPELTLQTTPQEEGLMIYDVLDGKYDDFLHAYAGDVSLFGRPVLMRLANEMNGDWCSYCAYHTCRDTDIYLEFYRYIFDIFIQEGADNAIWVWNPNHRSFPDFKWNDELMYYPGNEYVNVIGLTAYNTGSYYKGETWSSFKGETWSSFDELYRELYQRTLQRYARPMMITEFASNSVGGDKVQWINDMFSSLSDYPMIKAAVWWNSADWDYSGSEPVIARQYILEETQDTFNAFKDGLSHY